jgi:hypothetical protein
LPANAPPVGRQREADGFAGGVNHIADFVLGEVAPMNNFATRAHRWPFRVLLAILFLLAWAGTAWAQSPPDIVRVEEDWELVLGTPDADTDAPQVTCAVSPLGNLESWHAALELNQQSLPTFAPGGVQLQIWEGEVPLSDRRFPNGAVLAQPGETVHWTQSMQLSEGNLTFEVINGSSTTWGPFGGQGYLKASVATTLSSLNGYSPAVSVENSRVGYAANRVQSLVLKRVRYYTSTGQQIEDTTPRVVH